MALADCWARFLCKLSRQLVRRYSSQEVIIKCLPNWRGAYGLSVWHDTPANVIMTTTLMDYVELSVDDRCSDLREWIFQGELP